MSIARAWVIVLVILCCSCGFLNKAVADTVWLVIAASGKSIIPLLETKKRLIHDWPSITIITTDDCKNAQPGFFVLAAEIATDISRARKAVANLKRVVPDAYLKKCVIREQSCLFLGIPLVHHSIENVPGNVVSWSDADRITELKHLHGDKFIMVKRVFDPDDESFREGRQEQIYFFTGNPIQAVLLNDNCWDFGGVDSHGNLLAFHCASMAAGDHLIHTSMVYRLEPIKKIFEKSYCRNPILISDKQIMYEDESVDANGQLSLTRITEAFPLSEKK